MYTSEVGEVPEYVLLLSSWGRKQPSFKRNQSLMKDIQLYGVSENKTNEGYGASWGWFQKEMTVTNVNTTY